MDDKGRKRASIFYKATPRVRRAYILLSCRFDVLFDYTSFMKENVDVANVTDGDKVIHTTEPITANHENCYDVDDKAKKAAVEWLDKNHPDWRNPVPTGTSSTTRSEPSNCSHKGPSRNAILLGALSFSKTEIIAIFLKIYYSLGIRFANSELLAAKEKLEIVKSRGEAAPNFWGFFRRNVFELF